MSSGNTETRILQMQLDNKDFEDGVRQTIKSLENLEEKLNLKHAGDGFEKVSAAANSVQMSHLESGLDAVTNKFTLMGQIGLQVLERISAQVVNTGEKILRAATIQPMIDGWGEFEMKTNSVQTILGGIRNQFEDQPTAIHAISDALNELNEYADKTIYNFAQMTENVGKFTNQGLGLEESTNAIKGIANWAAAVGANPQQMSRAMYNISQSLGAGSMQLIDWRSIRFANMATPEVKNLFAEVAKRYGTVDEQGRVKVGKQLISVMDDFEGTLKAGWLTNDVMAEAFAIYANAVSEEELVARYGEELGRQFHEMGVYAEEAATKVRTFSQLIDVLKESLGSGWANTFDILFGGFEQQTAFLTAIKERIEEIINFQTDDRNTWLQNFSDIGGITVFQDVILKTIDILSDFYWVFNDVAALVLNPFGQSVFNMTDGIFGPRQEGYTEMRTTWEGVKGIFDDISNTLDRFRQWMYAPNEKSGRSPIHNLANALSGVAGAAGIAWQVLTGFGKFVFRIFKRFEPVVTAVLDLLGQIGGAIYNVFFNLTGQQTVEKFFNKLEGWIGPAVDMVANLAAGVINLIHSFLGIDSAADDWTVLGERMKAFWEIFSYDPNLDFADNVKNSVKKALTAIFGEETANSLIQAWDENVAPVLEQVSGFFEQAYSTISDFFINKLPQLGEKLRDFLFGKDVEVLDRGRWRQGHQNGLFENIQNYFGGESWTGTVEAVQKFFDPVMKAMEEAYQKVFDFLFGHEIIGKRGNTWREGGLFQSIQTYFTADSWSKTLESVQGFFDPIIDALQEAYNKVYAFLFGEDVEVNDNGRWRQGHNNGLFENIQNYFASETWAENWGLITSALEQASAWVTSTGEAAWQTIIDFLYGKDIEVNDNGRWRQGHQNGLFDTAVEFLDPVWQWIQEKGTVVYDYLTTHNFEEMWAGLNQLLFGYDVIGKQGNTWHEAGVLTPVIEMLQPISDAFANAKTWVLEKMAGVDWGSIWASIGKFFNGYDTTVFDQSGRNIATEHHEGAFEKIVNFFNRIIDYFQSPEFQAFLGTIKNFYHEYIEPVLNWIGGLGTELGGALSGLFSGQGFGAFEGVGTYLTNGFDTLIGKIFPEGSGGLQGILSGLFGETATNGQNAESGGLLGWLVNTLLPGAEAADADASAIADASGNIIAVLGQTENAVGKTADKGAETSGSIMDSVSKLLPYLGVAGGIALTGKVGDMITGITGNRKPTIIEQIGDLLVSFGDIFQGLGILVGAAAISEWVSPGALDKVFGHITSLLNTVFKWIAGIAGGGKLLDAGVNLGGSALGNKFGLGNIDFDSASSIISSIGSGISGLFEGLQTMYNLVWEVAGADLLLGADNFDKLLDRVLGFIGKVLMKLVGSEALTTVIDAAGKLTVAGLGKAMGVEAKSESMGKILTGLGAFISAASDGIAAIMTASIVPGIMNIDTSKIVDVINAVFTGIGALSLIGEIGSLTSLLGDKAGWNAFKALVGTGGGLAVALGAIGTVAGFLVDWFMTNITDNLTTMAPAIYSFISNFTGAIQLIASLGETQLGSAEKMLSEDLPRLLGYISPEELGYNKETLDDVGVTIRDLGDRIFGGINSLSKAKDVFDKYNTGGDFPLEFFREMTEALSYLNNDEVSELYDSVFGQNGFWVGSTGGTEQNIDGLNAFFSTVGSLGSVITEYRTSDAQTGISEAGTKVESTKEGLDAFRDAFSGIQTTFHSLMEDVTDESFDMARINTVAGLITKISEAGDTFVKSFYYEHGNLKTYDNTGPITQFSGWIQALGTAVHQMATAIQPEDESGLNQVNNTISTLASFIAKDVYTNLQNMSTEQISGYASAFESLKQSLLIPETSGSTVASMVQQIMDASSGKEVKLQITPVIDDTNLGANMPNGLQLENFYSRMLNLRLNMNEIQNVRVDASQIAQLVAANNATRDRIDTVASAIRQIRIQVNVPNTGYGPRARTVETYPLVANYINPYEEP